MFGLGAYKFQLKDLIVHLRTYQVTLNVIVFKPIMKFAIEEQIQNVMS